MAWYCYAVAAPVALWVWFFIGGAVLSLGSYLLDESVGDPSDMDDDDKVLYGMLTMIWPPIALVLAVVAVAWLYRHAPFAVARLLNRPDEPEVPKAKVVKK